jgi:hypothetical protein
VRSVQPTHFDAYQAVAQSKAEGWRSSEPQLDG